jgi:hypothetical protein
MMFPHHEVVIEDALLMTDQKVYFSDWHLSCDTRDSWIRVAVQSSGTMQTLLSGTRLPYTAGSSTRTNRA